MMEKASEVVREAALYMDGLKPDWWQHIDPVTFNLSDPSLCVCGQNGLNWTTTFYPGDEPNPQAWATAERNFEPLWLEEIASRMPAPADLDSLTVESAPVPAGGDPVAV